MEYRNKELIGILLAVLSLFLMISFVTYDPTESPGGISPDIAKNNIMGIFGIYTSYYLMKFTFGWASFIYPIILGVYSFAIFTRRELEWFTKPSIYIFGIGVWLSSIIAQIGISHSKWWAVEYSGLIGYSLTEFIRNILGVYAYYVIIFLTLIIIITGILKISIFDEFQNFKLFLRDKISEFKEKRRIDSVIVDSHENEVEFDLTTKEETLEEEINEVETESIEEDIELNQEGSDVPDAIYTDAIINPVETEESNTDKSVIDDDESEADITIEDEVKIDETNLDAQKERRAKYRQFKLPTTEFLENPIEINSNQDRDSLHEKADQLIHALETFGVQGRVVKISPGPVITLFEIEPGEGVRVNKFTNLADDLARVMKAQRIRVIAPIPGSKSVGIELPNEHPAIVYLKSIINSKEYVDSQSKLTIAVGKTTVGEAYTFELNKMPHLLVAGATGAGKSVCINTIIISILYKAKPDEVKFIMIDPKKLELATYKSLVGYHLITAPNLDEYVMTTAENAVGILDSAITEMERRFQVFADARVRNISEYHDRCKQNSDLENIPYIVVLIDELADLMMTSGRAVEEPITRLAQKARAVGIHLVVATQRPSVDVITGLIKSNFPARISFQVSSKVDSRTIIDQIGAEKLLGRGDLLFLLPGSASPIRLHNALIELDEIEQIMKHITSQPKPEEVMLPETKQVSMDSGFSVDDDTDELLKDAAVMVIETQQASVSMLQRKFRIGYSRAGRLIDELEALGIVSGYSGSKARDVLVDMPYLESVFGE